MKRPGFPRAKKYALACAAVEGAAAIVARRLWKHELPPKGWTERDEERLCELIEREVMAALSEAFDFS